MEQLARLQNSVQLDGTALSVLSQKREAKASMQSPHLLRPQHRMKMNHLRCVAGNSEVLYQGIDSLVVKRDGFERLKAAGEIRRIGTWQA